MLRVLIVIAWIALTVYAIADWFRTPEEELPARLPKVMWLILIIITIPSFSIGAIAWIVVRAVTRAEAGKSPLPPLSIPKPTPPPTAPTGPLAPDDDPEFLFRIERDIQREKRARTEDSSQSSGSRPTDSRPALSGPTESTGEGDGPSDDAQDEGPAGADSPA